MPGPHQKRQNAQNHAEPKRKQNGDFAEGTCQGPGRGAKPKPIPRAFFRNAWSEQIAVADFKKMIAKQAEAALEGDLDAFKEIARHMTPPVKKLEHTGEDGGAIETEQKVINLDPEKLSDGEIARLLEQLDE